MENRHAIPTNTSQVTLSLPSWYKIKHGLCILLFVQIYNVIHPDTVVHVLRCITLENCTEKYEPCPTLLGEGAVRKAKFSKDPVSRVFQEHFSIVYILIYFDGFISKKYVGYWISYRKHGLIIKPYNINHLLVITYNIVIKWSTIRAFIAARQRREVP